MKKCSVVWRFFERVLEDNRCVAVLCKLCETQYKYFGNTTNLRTHLTNKHPIQWELSQNGNLDETHFRVADEDTNQSTATPKRRKYSRSYNKVKKVRYSVSVDNNEDEAGKIPKIEIQRVLEQSDGENEDDHATINLVRQMHSGPNTDEEWLEEDPFQITHVETYEPRQKKMKYKKIKREIKSPPGLPGFYIAPKEKIVYEDNQRKDEYTVFGEYVANKLRKVKTPRTRGNLQQLITTLLWQAEYGMYDNPEAVKRVLMYSIQTPETEQETSTVQQDYIPQVIQIAEEVVEQEHVNKDTSAHSEGIEDVH